MEAALHAALLIAAPFIFGDTTTRELSAKACMMQISARRGVRVLEIKSNSTRRVPPRAMEVSNSEPDDVILEAIARSRLIAAAKRIIRGSKRCRERCAAAGMSNDAMLNRARRGIRCDSIAAPCAKVRPCGNHCCAIARSRALCSANAAKSNLSSDLHTTRRHFKRKQLN